MWLTERIDSSRLTIRTDVTVRDETLQDGSTLKVADSATSCCSFCTNPARHGQLDSSNVAR